MRKAALHINLNMTFRIWCPEDANKLLTRYKGSDKIRGIIWIAKLFQQGCHYKYLKSIVLERLLNQFGEILGSLQNRVREGDSCEELWLFSKSLGQLNKPNLSEQNQVEVEGFLGNLNVSLSAPNNSELLALSLGQNMDHEVSNTVNDLRLLKGIHNDGCDLSLSLNDSNERESEPTLFPDLTNGKRGHLDQTSKNYASLCFPDSHLLQRQVSPLHYLETIKHRNF
nr:hypothetical protein CFP56_18407 [Quercus suber]